MTFANLKTAAQHQCLLWFFLKLDIWNQQGLFDNTQVLNGKLISLLCCGIKLRAVDTVNRNSIDLYLLRVLAACLKCIKESYPFAE